MEAKAALNVEYLEIDPTIFQKLSKIAKAILDL